MPSLVPCPSCPLQIVATNWKSEVHNMQQNIYYYNILYVGHVTLLPPSISPSPPPTFQQKQRLVFAKDLSFVVSNPGSSVTIGAGTSARDLK